jgi:hypothetical protein
VPSDPDLDDRQLERLLSGRDAPSVSEREELFERIYARTDAGRRRWLAPALGAALASAAAGVLMFMQLRSPADAEFRARGSGLPVAGPELTLACTEGVTCRSGDKLSLAVRAAESAYFSAFARRFDGVVIWYFPEPLGASQALPNGGARAVLDRAVLLGPEHLPGRYEVFGVFTRRPFTRAEIKLALGDDLAGSAEAIVLRRSLEIAP